jgi:hypothetical protein
MISPLTAGGLLWLLGIYVQDVKRVLELVHNLHPPLPIWLKLAVQTLQGPARHNCRFMPSGMFIRQFLAYEIEFGAVVVDVEKVPRHGKASRDAGTSSRKLSCGSPLTKAVIRFDSFLITEQYWLASPILEMQALRRRLRIAGCSRLVSTDANKATAPARAAAIAGAVVVLLCSARGKAGACAAQLNEHVRLFDGVLY